MKSVTGPWIRKPLCKPALLLDYSLSFGGQGEGAEGVIGTELSFCLISYISNDSSDKLNLFSHSNCMNITHRTLTLLFK